jgi:hypothetical protein
VYLKNLMFLMLLKHQLYQPLQLNLLYLKNLRFLK